MTGVRFGTDSKNENDGGDDAGAVLIRKCVRELHFFYHFFGFVLVLTKPETLFTASWSPRQNAQNAHEAQQQLQLHRYVRRLGNQFFGGTARLVF